MQPSGASLRELRYDKHTRDEAIMRGMLYFWTGEPCKRGHMDFRATDNNACVTCQTRALNMRRAKKEFGTSVMLKIDNALLDRQLEKELDDWSSTT